MAGTAVLSLLFHLVARERTWIVPVLATNAIIHGNASTLYTCWAETRQTPVPKHLADTPWADSNIYLVRTDECGPRTPSSLLYVTMRIQARGTEDGSDKWRNVTRNSPRRRRITHKDDQSKTASRAETHLELATEFKGV